MKERKKECHFILMTAAKVMIIIIKKIFCCFCFLFSLFYKTVWKISHKNFHFTILMSLLKCVSLISGYNACHNHHLCHCRFGIHKNFLIAKIYHYVQDDFWFQWHSVCVCFCVSKWGKSIMNKYYVINKLFFG